MTKETMKNRVFGLDVLRAIAILIVVYGHSGIVAPLFAESFPNVHLPGGVDMFFVLSGFLIGGILINLAVNQKLNSFSDITRFWSRRWLRTLPLYYFILLINIGLTYFEILDLEKKFIDFSFFLFVQNFYDGFVGFFYESWSLSIEEWFYFLIPILIFILLKYVKVKTGLFLAILLMILFPLIYRVSLVDLNIDSFWYGVTFKKVVLCRLDAIGFGVLAAYVFIFYKEIWYKLRYVGLTIGLVLIVFTMFFRPPHNTVDAQTYFLSLLPIGVMFTMPFFYSVKSCSINWLRYVVTYISLISYSLYLTNLSIVALLIAKYLPETSFQSGVMNYVLFWLFTFVVSTLTYYFIEKPFLRLRKKSKL